MNIKDICILYISMLFYLNMFLFIIFFKFINEYYIVIDNFFKKGMN